MTVAPVEPAKDLGYHAYFARFHKDTQLRQLTAPDDASFIAVHMHENLDTDVIFLDKVAIAADNLLWSSKGNGLQCASTTSIRPDTAVKKLKEHTSLPEPWLIIKHKDPQKLTALASRFWQSSIIARIQTLIPVLAHDRVIGKVIDNIVFDGLSVAPPTKPFDPFEL